MISSRLCQGLRQGLLPWLSRLSDDGHVTTVVVDTTVAVPSAVTVDGGDVVGAVGQKHEQTLEARDTPHEAER
jgi:hypothetical protein